VTVRRVKQRRRDLANGKRRLISFLSPRTRRHEARPLPVGAGSACAMYLAVR
jgi:hypothetical protein